MFTARDYDLETGIYHYRARAYWPQLGSFLQFDPIDFAGGVNTYDHTMNAPSLMRDPTGQAAIVIPIVIGGGALRGDLAAITAGAIAARLAADLMSDPARERERC